MSSRVFNARLALLPLACSVALSAWAQQSLPEVVVSATRSEQPITDVLADVTLVDRAEIDHLGAASVADVLERLPGITVNRNGGLASTTNVYLRGAEGRFTASIGFGSGRSTFTVDALQVTSGAALPFATLTWGPLGLCGARVVSSGQGAIKLVAEDGRKVSPFLTGRAPTPLRSSFEAAQFAADDRPGPPGRFGGVFLIESDEGTISAVFLSDGAP